MGTAQQQTDRRHCFSDKYSNTVIVITMVLFFLLAVGIKMDIFTHIDTSIYRYFQTDQSKWLYKFLLVFRKLSGDSLSLLYWFIIFFSLLKLKKTDKAVFSAIIFFIAGFSGIVLKYIFQRTRPPADIAYLSGYSFPSGHVIIALTLALIIYSVMPDIITNAGIKMVILPTLILYVCLDFFSSVYLGAHYFTDCVGSVIVSFFALASSCKIMSVLKKSVIYDNLSNFMLKCTNIR